MVIFVQKITILQMNRIKSIYETKKFNVAFKIVLITFVILSGWLIAWVWILPDANY
jgi:hypothetical protein